MDHLAVVDRRSERRRSLGNIVAQIDCRDGDVPTTGIVWDLSSRGACFFVRHQERIPEQFDIVLDQTSGPAVVVWRSGHHIGVRFDDSLASPRRKAVWSRGSIRQVFQDAMLSLGLAGR